MTNARTGSIQSINTGRNQREVPSITPGVTVPPPVPGTGSTPRIAISTNHDSPIQILSPLITWPLLPLSITTRFLFQIPDPHRGIVAGSGQKPAIGAYKAIDYLMINARTVGAGLTRFSDFFRLINTWMSYSVEEHADEFRFALKSKIGPVPPPGVEITFTVLTMRARAVAGDDWSPKRISFLHQPIADTAPYEAFFRCPIQFGGDAAWLAVSREDWNAPIHERDEMLYGVLSDHASMLLEARPDPDDIVSKVKAQITRDLNEGEPDRATIAENLMMSERTLQRRLSERGLTFHDVVDQVRERLARKNVAGEDLTLTEVAFLLGYSESSAFIRAFKRWTGETPRAYRKRALSCP